MKTPERRQRSKPMDWFLYRDLRRRHSGSFIVNLGHISLTTFSSVSIVDFEKVNVSWVSQDYGGRFS